MKYNTQLSRLIMPEYGRNIHQMVDHCVAIQDREERTRCANTIIAVMGNLFPHLRDVSDFKHILWDHLAIMSDFRLDIDYPYDIIKKEKLYSKPAKLPYNQGKMSYRHYGKMLEKLIAIASKYPQGEEQERLVWLIVNYMKRSYTVWNKGVSDQRIFLDLFEMSGGTIDLRNSDMQLPEIKDLSQKPTNKKGGKRK